MGIEIYVLVLLHVCVHITYICGGDNKINYAYKLNMLSVRLSIFQSLNLVYLVIPL